MVVWGKCNVCSKKVPRQNRKYVSNVFCSKDCRVAYWRGKYGPERIKVRDNTIDRVLAAYRKKLKANPTPPTKDIPRHMPRLGPVERHYGMRYEG